MSPTSSSFPPFLHCPTPSMSILSKILNFFFIIVICIEHMFMYNLQSPFSIVHMYMCPGLTPCYLITYWRFVSGEDWFFLSQQSVIACSLHLVVGPCGIFPHPHWHVSWCCHCAGLTWATILLRFHGCLFLSYVEDIASQKCCGPLALIIFAYLSSSVLPKP